MLCVLLPTGAKAARGNRHESPSSDTLELDPAVLELCTWCCNSASSLHTSQSPLATPNLTGPTLASVDASWLPLVNAEGKKPYFKKLMEFVAGQRAAHAVYPAEDCVFAALASTPLDAVRVVVLGQDPYHGPGQAHGLSFSVPEGVKPLPPSLRNIVKEAATALPAGKTSESLECAAGRQGTHAARCSMCRYPWVWRFDLLGQARCATAEHSPDGEPWGSALTC